jgi:hypothetical protein
VSLLAKAVPTPLRDIRNLKMYVDIVVDLERNRPFFDPRVFSFIIDAIFLVGDEQDYCKRYPLQELCYFIDVGGSVRNVGSGYT